MRNTLSSRPDTSLSTSSRPTRSSGGSELKCARHPAKAYVDDWLSMMLGDVEGVIVSPRGAWGAEAVRRLGAGACRSAVWAGSLLKERVAVGLLSGEVGIVGADPGLRRRSRFSGATARCQGRGLVAAERPWERARRDWSGVSRMLIWRDDRGKEWGRGWILIKPGVRASYARAALAHLPACFAGFWQEECSRTRKRMYNILLEHVTPHRASCADADVTKGLLFLSAST